MKKQSLVIILVLVLFPMQVMFAESGNDKAYTAVTHVLFDYDVSFEYTTFKVRRRGHVDITFAENTPDNLFVEIVRKLKKHPDIKSVLASKGGSSCARFR